MREINKKGQLTLFIILGILIVAGIVGFFVYKNLPGRNISKGDSLVHESYLSCIESLTHEGVSIIGSSGGYIELPNYEAGSEYMPSSSQLDFLGSRVPYWYYVSGNNIVREKVPSMRGVEEQLELYISRNIQRCDMSDYENRGYLVDVDPGVVSVKIKENQIDVNVKNEMRVSFDEKVSVFKNHNIRVNSKLGKFYNIAREIYNHEKGSLFLESYAMDILQMYVPTTDVEMTCSPMFFNFQEIKKNLSEAISNNIPYLKLKGNYHKSKEDEYFMQDIGISVNEDVNFLTSSDWPMMIEIYGDDFAEPVGLQEGLGALGFCYVQYHFVYDLSFPVLVQIFDEKESFQFPVVVVIKKNQPRESIYSGDLLDEDINICANKEGELKVSTYDIYLNPVEADISISCLNSGCSLGKTKISGSGSSLTSAVPQCVNAIVNANAEGYVSGSSYVSTNEEDKVDIVLRKKYQLALDLGNLPGKSNAIVRFVGEGYSTAINYPDEKHVDLAEGSYNVSVSLFGDSSLKLPSYVDKRCIESSDSGLAGLFGSTSEKCFETVIPEQTIEGALIGGGNAFDYFYEEELKKSSKLNIRVPLFGSPSRIEDLTENYVKLEDSFIEMSFV